MANGVPATQLETYSKLVTQVGFPVIIAGILLWYVLGVFQKNMSEIAARMSTNADAIASLVKSEHDTLEEQRKQTVLMQQILVAKQNVNQ